VGRKGSIMNNLLLSISGILFGLSVTTLIISLIAVNNYIEIIKIGIDLLTVSVLFLIASLLSLKK
jgi:hypothetical protein